MFCLEFCLSVTEHACTFLCRVLHSACFVICIVLGVLCIQKARMVILQTVVYRDLFQGRVRGGGACSTMDVVSRKLTEGGT